ncbi:hypothetical protein HK102_011710, partial [Quaeritorhiza haematococci]
VVPAKYLDEIAKGREYLVYTFEITGQDVQKEVKAIQAVYELGKEVWKSQVVKVGKA